MRADEGVILRANGLFWYLSNRLATSDDETERKRLRNSQKVVADLLTEIKKLEIHTNQLERMIK